MKPLITPAPTAAHEEVATVRGERSGLEMTVAIHSTRLGPALGGLRIWHYPDPAEGAEDALRLSAAMTLKAAAAGLDLGGGKGVIVAPTPAPLHGDERRAALEDFGDLVESLGGRYITAEDVGTATEDMVVIRSRTRHVTGLPAAHGGAGDPSPYTAMGVAAAMRAALRHCFGSTGVAGRRITIVGLGHVGGRLARSLAADGATLTVTDVDPARRREAAALGARWLEPEGAMGAEAEVVAPCAVGGAIHAENVGSIRARIVCGAANNQLADPGLDEELARRGILYAPDFIANAGGLINVYRELRGYGADRARALSLGIEDTMERVIERAQASGITPLAAATALAAERLAGGVPDSVS